MVSSGKADALLSDIVNVAVGTDEGVAENHFRPFWVCRYVVIESRDGALVESEAELKASS